jgi:hypothetical protein
MIKKRHQVMARLHDHNPSSDFIIKHLKSGDGKYYAYITQKFLLLVVKGSGERKEGRRKEKRNKVNLVLLLVDETSLFL